jgi:probable HAF family extracellular repeat protein
MPRILSPRRWIIIVFLLAGLIDARTASAALEYTVTDLGPGTATGINAGGQVIGVSAQTGRSYLDAGAGMIDLGALPAPYAAGSYPAGINSSGEVVGQAVDSDYIAQAPLGTRAYLYSNGSMSELGTLGGSTSAAYGINDSGDIVGLATLTGDTAYHAFFESNGIMTDLGTLGGQDSEAFAVNGNGQVVGSSSVSGSSSSHAFLFTGGVMTDLGTLGGGSSSALGINSYGQVVGYSGTASGALHAFLYDDGTLIDLGTLGGDGQNSQANAINDSGEIVGESGTGMTGPHAFLYIGGTMLDLNSLINPSLGWTILDATGINDSGQIVAYGFQNQTETDALLLTPIPEPGALCLLTLYGVIGLSMRSRHHKSRR